MKRRWIDFTSALFTASTGLACLVVVSFTALILGNIVLNGSNRTWFESVDGPEEEH